MNSGDGQAVKATVIDKVEGRRSKEEIEAGEHSNEDENRQWGKPERGHHGSRVSFAVCPAGCAKGSKGRLGNQLWQRSDPGDINGSHFPGMVGAVEKWGECRRRDSEREQLSRSLAVDGQGDIGEQLERDMGLSEEFF